MELINAKDLPCCPDLAAEPVCDRLRFEYVLERRQGDVTVEVSITAVLERCPGPLALGDLVYSTTLLPGERVRLVTQNRRNRFTYDSETQVSYRHEQASEETYYMASMDSFMSDVDVVDAGGGGSRSSGSFSSEASTNSPIGAFFSGGRVRASGNYDGQSSYEFSRRLSAYARSSHERSVAATRAANSVSVGEVTSRTRVEGESESSYEGATRTITNENRCQAVTYFAYQVNKTQTTRFTIEAVTARVVDPVANTTVRRAAFVPSDDVAVIPSGVLAASRDRLERQTIARAAAMARAEGVVASPAVEKELSAVASRIAPNGVYTRAAPAAAATMAARQPQPLSVQQRQTALRATMTDLARAGFVADDGRLTEEARRELSFEVTTVLPTTAVIVKGCLDPCVVCEPSRQEEIKLELERKRLENRLLERQIELLDKAQEYRCCPADETEDA
ncbi:MAG: hypothetical protein EA355_07855 [Rhodobacteraceae bacterium]|nr:MAG: hypothetical protein EA355_07855 [Paracoccaceae bacterium]